VILVTGLPGTGKTVLALALSRRYALPLLAKDTIKEPLMDVLGAGSRIHSRRLSDASFAVLFALAHQLLGAGFSLILEGNFRRAEHERALLQACSVVSSDPSHALRMVQVLCCAAEPERFERLRARQHDPSRHAGHRDALLATSAGGADFLEIQGERIVFDSSGAGTHAGVLRALDAWFAR